MKAFAALFRQLDETRSSKRRQQLLADYFSRVGDADLAWSVFLLMGRRQKRLVGPRTLRSWLQQLVSLPDWLIEESYQHVGDLAETVVLMRPEPDGIANAGPQTSLAAWLSHWIVSLAGLDEAQQREQVLAGWRALPDEQCFLFTKCLTGALRVGVSRGTVERALSEWLALPRALIAQRLTGDWQPDEAFGQYLKSPARGSEDRRRPYPFFLASPLTFPVVDLGERDQWQVEWKWDGIRAQLVCRDQILIWSRGEELMQGRFPEVESRAATLPADTVLDGELLAWQDGVLPFQLLQTRLQRKQVDQALQSRAPVHFMAYDLLEWQGEDCRAWPLHKRRKTLESLHQDTPEAFLLSPLLDASGWDALARMREQSRDRRVEGLMLKRRQSAYGFGRQRGDWWKWKVAPLTLDAVLMYAQPGHGRRASLYTDYTFAVRSDQDWVPIARAYSGLDQTQIEQLDRWIRAHTRERFGPVRRVEPSLVFELGFDGLQRSSRHKSGIALRFPRILRRRDDLAATDADTLDAVEEMLDDLAG